MIVKWPDSLMYSIMDMDVGSACSHCFLFFYFYTLSGVCLGGHVHTGTLGANLLLLFIYHKDVTVSLFSSDSREENEEA